MKLLTKNILGIIFTLLALALLFSAFYSGQEKIQTLSLDQLATKINSGEVSKITVMGNDLNIDLKNNQRAVSKKEAESGLSETLKNYGVDPNALQKVSLEIQEQSGLKYWLSILIPVLLPIILIGAFFWFTFRQARTGMNQAFTFGRANIKLFSSFKNKITFADVAGLKEAKQELMEVVDFLKNPKKYLEIGAKIPKGVLLLGSPGTGKCITGESLILTNKGLLPIADIPKYFSVENNEPTGARVMSFNEKTSALEWQNPSHWYNLGIQKTIKIRTQLGTAIEGTPEHPLVVLNQADGKFEFRHLSQIKKNDLLVVSYNQNVFGNYNKISDEKMAYLLGLLVGDGGLTTKGRVSFTSSDPEIINEFKSIVKEKWNYEPIQKTKYDYQIFSGQTKKDLINYGLTEVYSENKRIPETILLAPENIVAAFLRGIFDTDGYCGKEGVELSSSSKDLISTIHLLLLNFGIVNRISERRKKYNGKLQYYISISGDFLVQFDKKIGFKLKRKQFLLQKLLKKSRNTNNNLIYGQANNFKSLWLTLKEKGFEADRNFYRNSFYKNIFRYARGERNPSVGATVKVLSFLETTEPAIVFHPSFARLKNLSSSKFFFTPVVEFTEGQAEVFDFTVPDNHSFVANGFINHNTLLARAVAGEAEVPFFHISASEFVEMFVGVGASRTRDAFATAKKAAPAILFVDEIDAVGRERGAGLGGGHDEREQTLNQILVEMDGFDNETNVIVLAATNRPDVLDPALLRPGRFDRRVILDLPDINDREAILKIHSRSKPLSPTVVLKQIAIRTPGFSGADLENLMNEAAILTARRGEKEITQNALYESIEKVLLGPERRSRVLSQKEKEITAYHEAGHALIAASLKNTDPVHKVSVVARGHAGGYTLKLPSEDVHLKTKTQFISDLAVMMGGFSAEEIMFKDVSTGASNDLQTASELARRLVTKFGMSEKLGPMTFGKTQELIFLGREIATEKNYSEKVATQIDEEVKKFIERAYTAAKKIITSRKNVLEAIAKKLMAEETIEREEFDKLIKGFRLKPLTI